MKTDKFLSFFLTVISICKELSILISLVDFLCFTYINKRPRGPHIVHLSTICATFFMDRSGRPFLFTDGPEKHNCLILVEDVRILLSVKFCWIPFSGFRGKVENVSANQRPARPSCFFWIGPKKHKIGRGRWDLASCQVSLKTVKRFQRSRKCLRQSEAEASVLFFRSAWMTQNW